MTDEALARRLQARIADEGPLPLDAFWREAMTAPGLGYYMSGQPIGRGGDFTTAPEISQIFGELIGLWLVEAWRRAGAPAAFALVELGPGRGQLMADALRAASLDPAFGRAARLVLAEASPAMRAAQADRLADTSPEWRDDWQAALAATNGLPLFLVANEFFDALPIRQFRLQDGQWRERLVGIAATGGFTFEPGPPGLPDDALAPDLAAAPDGAILEFSPDRAALATAIGRRLADVDGAALVVDYGHGADRLGDSLQALQDGKPADPLLAPGMADMTSHVNFARIKQAAEVAGARAWGPVDQGAFLLALGAEARADGLKRRAAPETAGEIDRALRRLTHPLAMGSLFKAMAFQPAIYPAPAGFET